MPKPISTPARSPSARPALAKRRPTPKRPVSEGAAAKPLWDASRRELHFEGMVVKQFRTPASCQELILATFEVEGWPERIDDPLRYVSGKDPKRRLHNAINCLNRSHLVPAIQFHGDGTGTGIVWKRV